MGEGPANHPEQDVPSPTSGAGDVRLPALTTAGRLCVTRKTAIGWGVLVSALASAATGVTALVDYWGLDIEVPEWYGMIVGFAVGAIVARFVPTQKVEHVSA